MSDQPRIVRDTETGLSIRLIREWKPEDEKFVTVLEWTFPHMHVRLADGYCGICGCLLALK